MTFIVEKDVPLPPRKGGGKIEKYPFRKMDVGDSFAVPITERCRVAPAVSVRKTRHPERFVLRTLRDEGVIRVWRVA